MPGSALPDIIEGANAPTLGDQQHGRHHNEERDRLDYLEAAPVAGQRRILRPHPDQVITIFDPSHGWTIGTSGAGTDLNSTEAFVRGTQAAKVVTLADGSMVNLERTGLALDATGKYVRLTVRIDDLAALPTTSQGINFFLTGDNFATFYRWRVVVGPADGAGTIVRNGDWVTITLAFGDAAVTGTPNRASLNRARLQAIDQAGGPAIVARFDGVEFVPESPAWPNGVVTIAFDDSWQDVHTYGRPAMDRYGFQATNYIICDSLGTGSKLTVAELRALQDVAGWDVQAHSYDGTNHNAGFVSLTDAVIEEDCLRSKDWAMRNGFGAMDHFAYPLGNFDARVAGVVGRYFSSARTVVGEPTTTFETPEPGEPLRLRAVSGVGSGTRTPANIAAWVDRTRTGKGWLILVFHRIVPGVPATSTECSQADFTAIIDDLAADGIPVRTVSDVLQVR